MKQPLMLMPPAQAEALYDAALANGEPGRRSRVQLMKTDDWDDQGSTDGLDAETFTGPKRLPSSPRIPLRASLRHG